MSSTRAISGPTDSAGCGERNILSLLRVWFALCCWLAASGAAWAQVTVVTTGKEEPICSDTDDPFINEPVNVCNVYARLAEPSVKLLAVGSADITTDDPAGFYQHPFDSTVHAPPCFILGKIPSLACDSFVTIGLKCGPFGRDPDATAVDPSFNAIEFELGGHVVGGWFNATPTNGQGLPDENGDVLVVQLAVTVGFDISGSFTAYVQGDFGGEPGPCPDFDEDDEVGPFDLAFLLGNWGACKKSCPADLDGDGTVGVYDLAILLGAWGPCIPAGPPPSVEAFELEFSCFGPECDLDGDCDDGDPCTADTCVEGACTNSQTDCNDNEIPDCDDIAETTSADCNGNSIPDECEHGAVVLYVDDDGDSGNGCTCWTDACPDLQTALGMAQPGEQIWVADGTYTPAPPEGDRSATFQLLDGVALYGGFAGFEGTLEARVGLFDQTVLSGDLSGNDVPEEFPGGESYSDNSYHVVTGSGTGSTATIDGFRITSGNADGEFPHNQGGGLYNEMGSPTVAHCTLSGNAAQNGAALANIDNSSPMITDCIFAGNSAVIYGGGIYNLIDCDPTIEDSTFEGNSAESGGAIFNTVSSPEITDCVFAGNSVTDIGGGIVNWNGSISQIVSCTFVGNSAGTRGGAMFNQLTGAPRINDCLFSVNTAGSGGGIYNWDSSPIISKCKFLGNATFATNGGAMYNLGGSPIVLNSTLIGNSAIVAGGGMYNGNTSVTVANCAFSGNSTIELEGGGMFNTTGVDVTMTNCTFSMNTAQGAGGGVYSRFDSEATLTNCILWANSVNGRTDATAQIHEDGTSTTIVNYSDVQGGWSGAGGLANLDLDPLFGDADGPDNIIGTPDDNLRPLPGSPVLDAANNNAVPSDVSDLDDDGDTQERLPFDLDDGNRFIDNPAAPDCPQPKADCGIAPIVDMGAYELGVDCNENGIPDHIDIENETSDDCNGNGIPDECEVPPIGPPENDCNGNDVPDDCDIAGGSSDDCNANGVPDECELPESCAEGICTDGCDADCNANCVIDSCDVDPADPDGDGEVSADCDGNAIPDECDLDPLDPDGDGEVSDDCNENAIPDECDIADCPPETPECDDCNVNGVPDQCDIDSGLSEDTDLNGVPDECVAAQADGDWSADIWGLEGDNPYPDNEEGVPDQAVTLDGVSVFLDVDAEVPALRLINAATLDVTQDGAPGDLTIADASGVFDGNLLIKGTLNIGGQRVIDAAGTVTVGAGGVYKSILGFDGPASGDMIGDEIVIDCGGTLRLEGSMNLDTQGNFTMQDSEDDGKGDCTPPDFDAGDNSSAAVGGNFIILGPADIVYDSTQPLLLGGNFDNQSTNAVIFDWSAGGILLNGPLHTIEAAGEERGHWPAGLVDNFAIGTLTLPEETILQVVDTFDNQQDGSAACDEALYVETCVVETGATLLTNGCRVYYRELFNNGSIPGLGVDVLEILEPVPADFNGDGVVDAFDLAFLLGHWGDCPEPCTPGEPADTCATDLNGDCVTEAFDLAALLGSWG